MDVEKELKEKLLKLVEETDRQAEEQDAYIQELRQRLSLAEKVCFEATGYLNNTEMPLVPTYLKRMASAVEKWDSYRESKGAQYVVTEDWVMMKCRICGDVFDVGYEMPNGDSVCATHECCYEYCKCEGKRITQGRGD